MEKGKIFKYNSYRRFRVIYINVFYGCPSILRVVKIVQLISPLLFRVADQISDMSVVVVLWEVT
eukprot:UN15788